MSLEKLKILLSNIENLSMRIKINSLMKLVHRKRIVVESFPCVNKSEADTEVDTLFVKDDEYNLSNVLLIK